MISTAQVMQIVGEAKLRHEVSKKRWRYIHRGVLFTESGPLTREQQWWVGVLIAGPESVLGGLAAAQAAGLRGRWRRAIIDILRPARLGARDLLRKPSPELPAIKVHRVSTLFDEDIQPARPYRTTTERALVDAAGWAHSDAEAVSLISAGCQQRLVAPADIVRVAAKLTRTNRRALIMETADFADKGATTPSEIDFVKMCRHNGLPQPKMQVTRVDRAGVRRYLDAYFADFGIHVEIDGAHHMDARQWAADLKRQNDVWIGGDRILRFPAYLIRTKPDEVVAQLRAALRAAGWIPRP
ncbi:very-short-patch-repair endonuclease [Allocatelliglobosispora scoriae]|uniref:Very-short-patch-repair endonuclease n=1 Tax=Allocatelliglobosispora scoriae TaxID=643052 RepID=A0A841BUP5_9ACTN|nr:hypothetical protein [Allocatelliglobosispora scoriae]MBB5870879.1 very-short-patch-repair endonuclease [Allocatelliglobosispora scoriae]